MAHLVELLLSIPEVRSSTPDIGKILIEHLFEYLFIINCSEKTKINKKEAGNGLNKKSAFTFWFCMVEHYLVSLCARLHMKRGNATIAMNCS